MTRSFFGAAAIAIVALSAVLIGTASAKPPAPPGTNTSCPKNVNSNYLALPTIVGAYSTGTTERTYYFNSIKDEGPSAGVPGLMNYCVYTNQPTTNVTAAAATGFTASKSGTKNFSFTRPGGNSTNIPLDGTLNTEIGTAVFNTEPTNQTILLHINDATACNSLYGGDPGTCYVLGGPICNGHGDLTGVGYTSLPKDVINCSPPSEAFEAQSAREFGDEVVLNTTTGNIKSLTVDFQSYACSTSGHWNLGETSPCVTTGTPTFSHAITANIYAKSTITGTPGALLGTVTQTFNDIPYRPSADPNKCSAGEITGQGIEAGSQWFNPAFGTCQYSIGKLLTFTFGGSGIAVPADGDVIWTVAFNTSDYGANPLRPQACNALAVGCPYDSLNVGAKSYFGAPYVGTDVDPNGAFLSSTWTGGYCDNGTGGTGSLRLDTGTPCWAPYKPLGQVNVGP